MSRLSIRKPIFVKPYSDGTYVSPTSPWANNAIQGQNAGYMGLLPNRPGRPDGPRNTRYKEHNKKSPTQAYFFNLGDPIFQKAIRQHSSIWKFYDETRRLLTLSGACHNNHHT